MVSGKTHAGFSVSIIPDFLIEDNEFAVEEVAESKPSTSQDNKKRKQKEPVDKSELKFKLEIANST